ncbi:hypothetical protein ABIA10_006541 [Rhizobium leguminosarum]
MALISLVEPEDVGVVLTFSQAFVGWMTEFPVRRPGAKLDLGNQGRLDPDNIGTSGIGHGWLLSLPSQRVQHLPQSGGLGFFEARADAPHVDELITTIRSEHQRAEARRECRRPLIADDEESLALNAFDFHPIAGSAGRIGPIEVLADDAFQAEAADMLKQNSWFGIECFR